MTRQSYHRFTDYRSSHGGVTTKMGEQIEKIRPKKWVEPAARAGLAARGAVYGMVGVLALMSAIGQGGTVGGSETAVSWIGGMMFGRVLLGLTAVGLFGYAAWQFVRAGMDPEAGAGTGIKRVLKRLGWGVSGLSHGALGVAAIQLMLGSGASGEEGKRSWIAALMGWEWGPALVAVAGVAIIGVGVGRLVTAWNIDFAKWLDLRSLDRSHRKAIIHIGRAGIAAQAIVLGIVGFGVVRAGMNTNPGEVRGVGGALVDIASQPSGGVLLAIVAAGLVAFAIEQFTEARYRRIASPQH